ncbi:MAG: hypothetical protein V1837_05045 [Candidatus Woesearchaeota archaeon]
MEWYSNLVFFRKRKILQRYRELFDKINKVYLRAEGIPLSPVPSEAYDQLVVYVDSALETKKMRLRASDLEDTISNVAKHCSAALAGFESGSPIKYLSSYSGSISALAYQLHEWLPNLRHKDALSLSKKAEETVKTTMADLLEHLAKVPEEYTESSFHQLTQFQNLVNALGPVAMIDLTYEGHRNSFKEILERKIDKYLKEQTGLGPETKNDYRVISLGETGAQ